MFKVRQGSLTSPWHTERHGYDPTSPGDQDRDPYLASPLTKSGGQAVLGRQLIKATPWVTEGNGKNSAKSKGSIICFVGSSSVGIS